jgi:molybdenum-dependent DNA-binding transcriptional regulator ModE
MGMTVHAGLSLSEMRLLRAMSESNALAGTLVRAAKGGKKKGGRTVKTENGKQAMCAGRRAG